MKRIAVALLLVLAAPLLYAVPAHAVDEPAADPLASCEAERDAWKIEAAYWMGDAEAATASELRAADRALAAEGRAEAYARQLGARTVERDRLLNQNNRLRLQRNQLKATVRELRQRLLVAQR